MNRVRLFFTGILINLQFFTSIPIKKEFSLHKRQLTYSLQTFPILGLIQGGMYAGLLYLLDHFTPFSDLMNALFLWLLLIILSGGIHLDGWIDSSDAYFSYKDPIKRLDILQDPRVGAFGVLSVLVFLFVRFVVLFELIRFSDSTIYVFIILIPFLGKTLMGLFLQTMPLARKEGMASFFQQGKSKHCWLIYILYILLLGSILMWINSELLISYLIFIAVIGLAGILIARSITKNFTGINGDTLGASSEGMELLLWITLWLLHSYGMV